MIFRWNSQRNIETFENSTRGTPEGQSPWGTWRKIPQRDCPSGALEVPKICLLLNPVPSTIFLLILKKCNVRIIGALGVGFMMFSILLMIAGFQI